MKTKTPPLRPANSFQKAHKYVSFAAIAFAFFLFTGTSFSQGLEGYIVSSSQNTPAEYNKGLTFYSAVWRLIPNPIQNFQIGLPSTWISPNNRDNTTIPLCPLGTQARDNWPERAPTYQDVFQTIEGGLGWWGHNRYHYGPPKFIIGGTASCYSSFLGNPNFGFSGNAALPDSALGIVQLSNRLLMPPDGLPFDGNPHGEFLGYGYLALPLTEAKTQPQPTGNLSWTLFFNTANFKGPIAFWLPETWSAIAKNYPVINGRTLDSRVMKLGDGGTMEINTVPLVKAVDSRGKTYTKIPQIQFPLQESGKSILVRDLAYYSDNALYNDVENWRKGGAIPTGAVNPQGVYYPTIRTSDPAYRQERVPLEGIKEMVTSTVFSDNSFGFQWKNASGTTAFFPQYFSDEGTKRVVVNPSDVPASTGLLTREFPRAVNSNAPRVAELKGAWTAKGPAAGPFSRNLADGSVVVYYWYRFIDQPVFQRNSWTNDEKSRLQALVEQMHANWTIDKNYIAPPKAGKLVSVDTNLIVTPPAGLEKGYVPVIVGQYTQQEYYCTIGQIETSFRDIVDAATGRNLKEVQVVGENAPYKIQWSNGTIGSRAPIRPDETFHLYVTDKSNCRKQILSAPVALPERGADNTSFIAVWKAVPGALMYGIQVATDSTFRNLLPNWQNVTTTATRIEVNRASGGVNLYYYRVRAIGGSNEQSPYSNVIPVAIGAPSCRLDVTAAKSNVSRVGATDGQITVAIKGGTAPYTYRWSNGAQTARASNLGVGTYTVTVTDAARCETSLTVDVSLPIGRGSIGNRVWHDLNQNGLEDFGEPGIANVSLVLWRDANGDGTPETFVGTVKTDNNGNYRFSNLTPGAYQVFVWELNNWKQGEPLFNMVNSVGESNPNNDLDGDDNGQDPKSLGMALSSLNVISKPIILTADGEPLLDGDPASPDVNFDPSGNMTVDFGFYLPTNCPTINGQLDGTAQVCTNKSDGKLTVNMASGTPPFAYKWSTGETGPTISNLKAGKYTVSVTDAKQCTGEITATIDVAALSACAPTSVKNDLLEKEDVYPNPVNNYVTIANSDFQLLTATMYDAQGKVLWVQQVQHGDVTVDMSSLTNGLYFLQLQNPENQTTKTYKLMKIR